MDNESRYWIVELDPQNVREHFHAIGTFGTATVGIVDEEKGGIILYIHRDNAQNVVSTLNNSEA